MSSLHDGEENLIAKRYAEAVVALQKALDEEPVERRDRVLVLLARAQELAGDPKAAIATYERLLRDLPDARLADRARLERAEALVRSRRMQEAAAAYREQIEKLTGPQRKETIAQTYLGLADKALVGDHPDPRRAVTFYDLAIDLGLAPERARNVRLLAADAVLKAGDAADAVRRLEPLVGELAGKDEERRARLLLGDAFHRLGDPSRARATYRDLCAKAPDSTEASDASFRIAETFGVPQPGPQRLDLAIAALDAFAKRYPTHGKARIAQFLAAQSYLSAARSEDALAALKAFVEKNADEPLDEIATARALIGDVLFGQGKVDDAIAAWRGYLAAHASHAEWERVQRAIVDAEFWRAERAVADERWADARKLYEDFGRDHPLDPRNADVLRRIGETFASESKWAEARQAFERCVKKYPGREESSAAQFRIGDLWENQGFDYQRALDAYRAVTWGSHQPHAQARIRRLEQKSLGLRTAKTFRVGEAASFALTSRNVPEVRVRVFKLDLETWFRATHLPGSVERLDIEVIAPDKTFASPVPEYVPYKETARDVPIGFTEPGCYVVKVDDQAREATTMVLVTDLGLIVKSSRTELLAFTQDLSKDRVESGVRVVVSDGQKILTEGRTDDAGMFRWKSEKLAEVSDLRVFAVDASGSGAGTLDLSALATGEGLTARVFLCTDRPAYLPGQSVHVKGIVRDVKDGLYVLPQARSDERLRVVSPSGRVVVESAVAFTEFGTLALDVDLPVEAELGTWRATLDRGNGREGSIPFEVARFELPRLMLAIEPAERIVFRGEAIAGHVALRHFYGEPARGRAVEVVLRRPDGSNEVRRGSTNAEGRLDFSFETQEFTEEALAVLSATVAEDGLAAQAVVPVVTSEFVPAVTVKRDVQLVGQTFDVTVRIADRSGGPLAKAGEILLLRKETTRRGTAEVEVARKPFRTSGDSGTAELQFSAPKSGVHVLRAQAMDRFGQLLSAERQLTISGDDDELKLRVLSDRQSWRVGETLEARIVNRAGEKLALRTLQADGVLACEAVRIPAGESVLRLPLDGRHAPNFALALAMIDGTALREAETEFFVARDLTITVKPSQEVAEPGSEIEVAVEAKDSQGKPVAAEVAVALVEASLLAMYADQTPDLAATFWGMRRQTVFRTVSSCGWSYDGPSRPVSEALLAEERRRAEADRADLAEHSPEGELRHDADRDFGRRFPAPGSGPTGGMPQLRAFAETTRGLEPQAQTAAQMEDSFSSNVGQFLQQQAPGQSFFKDGGVQEIFLGVGVESGGYRYPAGQIAGFDVFALGTTIDLTGAIRLPEISRATDAPRTAFASDGAWLSSVRTDDTGRATVKLRMPDRASEWQLVARGTTRETDVGKADAKVRTARDLVVDLSAPAFLVGKDQSIVRVRLHNRSDEARKEHVTVTVGDAAQDRDVTLTAGQEETSEVAITAGDEGALRVALAARGDRNGDAELTIPVVPFGIELRDGRAGVLVDAQRFTLTVPSQRGVRDLAMRIELAFGTDAGLAAAALAPGSSARNCRMLAPSVLATASRAIGAFAVLLALDGTGDSRKADRVALEALASAAVQSLVSIQRADGAFAWMGQGEPDLRATAAAVRALRFAKARGSRPAADALQRASAWLNNALRGARDDQRAEPERALAEAGEDRFESLNALHRRRAGMDLASLGRLALAWRALGRVELATEVDATSKEKLGVGPLDAPGKVRPIGDDPSRVEALALVAQSLLAANAGDAIGVRIVEWLEAQRVGPAWATPEATAAAIEALANATRRARRTTGGACSVVARVNTTALEPVAGRDGVDAVTIDVPASLLREGENVVELELDGAGPIRFAALLRGFAKDFTDADRNRNLVRIDRKIRPDRLRENGRAIQPGFGVVSGRYDSFDNLLTQLPVGAIARVETTFWAVGDSNAKLPVLPFVVEEPIPAGCTVPRASIQGSFERVEVLPDRIVAWYRDAVRADTLRYELVGRFPGKYRALPTVVYGALRPDLVAFGTPASLAVLPRGEATSDAYRLTPDELWELGKAAFERKDHDRAHELLSQLAENWTLRGDVLRELARMMLFVSIQRNDARGTVRWFEELKDRYPDLVVPFEDIRAVGRAYVDIGEFESAVLVFRGTTEASFLKDAGVATTLESLGEVQASVRFLQGLLDVYPALNTMRQSLYGIGQKLGMLAGAMKEGQAVDPKVGARAALFAQANVTLREFLVQFPDDPLAEEVSFAWATTLIESGKLADALAVAIGALARYPGSTMEDEFLYTAGYARFVLGKPDEALAAVRRVASERFPRAGGGSGPSENEKHAIYLEGQIHHALGHAEAALSSYDKVVEDFQDATEAAGYFRKKALSVAEVTRFATTDAAEIELTWRNLEEAAIKVYRVDLMRLYLLHKSLDNVSGILLHGIRPFHEATAKLGEGKDWLGERKSKVALPLTEPGAYLVVVRAGDLLASGLVLRTDLEIDAQESLDIGRVRVNVKRGGAFVPGAQVKVVGSGDGELRGGATDPRGIFVADGLVGRATVIAQVGDAFAFHRGSGVHQPQRFVPAPQPQADPQGGGGGDGQQRKGKSFEGWENNLQLNGVNRARQVEWLKNEVLDKQQRGVEVYRAK